MAKKAAKEEGSHLGSIFALVAGILQIINAVFMGLFGIVYILIGLATGEPFMAIFGVVFFFLALLGVVAVILLFLGYKQMKANVTCKSGAIKALVGGIISFNVFGIVAGVLGLNDAKKR